MDNNIFYKPKQIRGQGKIINGVIIFIIAALLFLSRNKLMAFISSVTSLFQKYSSYFITGLTYTVVLSAIALVAGIILGVIIYFMRISKSKVVSGIAKGMVELLRGTPLMVQLFIAYYGPTTFFDVRSLGIPTARLALISGAIAVSINSGAYVSEIIRSGIQSIGKGQMEAGRSLGMSYGETMKEIIMPQAVKNILPALGNEFITLIKETSIVSVVGVGDIMYNVKIVQGASFKPMEPLIVAAVLYFVLTFSLSKLLGIFERRLKESD